MANWRPISEKPPEGLVVAIFDMHWKREGWMSVSIDFGRVENGNRDHPDLWRVAQCDERGNGGEWWTPGEEFSHWMPADELTTFPEGIEARRRGEG